MSLTNVTNRDQEMSWHSVNWREANQLVNNLRQRIYKATKDGDIKRVRSLQKLALRSTANQFLAIRRVTQTNAGKHTPGVDNVVVTTSRERENLVNALSAKWGDKPLPTKRVYIPKSNGKKRPLGIPTVIERCKQAIVKTALEPYWEAKFERISYGFRPGRSAQDAMQKIFLFAKTRARRPWVLDADIQAAFDEISHDAVMKAIGNFPARQLILGWLKAGVMEKGIFSPSKAGTPQGGIISPLLANIVLHGMEKMLGVKYEEKHHRIALNSPYAVIRYADDFVVFAKTQPSCEAAKQKIEAWLNERGLTLSKEKTRITTLKEGFNFLGFNYRHYRKPGTREEQIPLVKPSKEAIKSFRQEMRRAWKEVIGWNPTDAIRYLNAKILGWGNYYRSVVSKAIFSKLDDWMYTRQVRYLYRMHPNKYWWWYRKHYFGSIKGHRDRWVFMHKKSGIYMYRLAWIKIERHVLIKGTASPDDATLRLYWQKRQAKKVPITSNMLLWKKQSGLCPQCNTALDNGEKLHTHHHIPKKLGGDSRLSNLRLLHASCYQQIHSKRGRSVQSNRLLEPYAG